MGEAGTGAGVVKHTDLIVRSAPQACVSKDGHGPHGSRRRKSAPLTMRNRERMAATSIFALARRPEPG
jgi:hypothetical protein